MGWDAEKHQGGTACGDVWTVTEHTHTRQNKNQPKYRNKLLQKKNFLFFILFIYFFFLFIYLFYFILFIYFFITCTKERTWVFHVKLNREGKEENI